MQLTDRFQSVFNFAVALHAGHFQKGTRIPYISHLMFVEARALKIGAGQ